MVFFRNVQVRWMPIQGDTQLTLALERPGASGDPGVYADRIELQNVTGALPAARLLRRVPLRRATGATSRPPASLAPDQVGRRSTTTSSTCRGDATGWGINLSSNLKLGEATSLRLQFVFGEGIQNYMNDAPVDVGIVDNLGEPA